MSTARSIVLDSFELTVGNIADVELAALHALSLGVRWPHRSEDWQFLREVGRGIVALDEIGRVLGTAMWFPYGPDFATIGMVITSPRLQANGAGRWMMEHVQDQADTRNLGLNATRAAHRLYLSMGFTDERTLYQYNGVISAPAQSRPPAGAQLRDIGPADLAELAALDRRAFGADRPGLLARLLEVSRGTALLRGEHIKAFALCRRFGRGYVVGPVVAATDADAIAVVSRQFADHAGDFVRLDTRQQSGAFPEFLVRSGLPIYDTVTSMSRGRPWLATEGTCPTTYALVSQALG